VAAGALDAVDVHLGEARLAVRAVQLDHLHLVFADVETYAFGHVRTLSLVVLARAPLLVAGALVRVEHEPDPGLRRPARGAQLVEQLGGQFGAVVPVDRRLLVAQRAQDRAQEFGLLRAQAEVGGVVLDDPAVARLQTAAGRGHPPAQHHSGGGARGRGAHHRGQEPARDALHRPSVRGGASAAWIRSSSSRIISAVASACRTPASGMRITPVTNRTAARITAAAAATQIRAMRTMRRSSSALRTRSSSRARCTTRSANPARSGTGCSVRARRNSARQASTSATASASAGSDSTRAANAARASGCISPSTNRAAAIARTSAV